jgi:lysyl-tRNA synthetase class 2
MSRLDETRQAKIEKRQKLVSAGIVPHPYIFDKKQTVADARSMNDQSVQTAGRIMGLRTHGKVSFIDLSDHTGSIQVMIRAENVGDETWEWLNQVDRGDFLGVDGKIMTTQTGELTILANQLWFLGKALRSLPTEFNLSQDKEVRFRKRYIDMLINPETKKVLDARWLITKEIRRFLQDQHNFVEVETPILQPLYGGTNATPFTTHMKALDTDFYLRIAPELYLKRLIVGGYDKVFEIARNFRNEGLDQTHQPEFTMIEWYEAYADYHRMMDVTEGLILHLVSKLQDGTKIKIGEQEIELGGKWPRLSMSDSLKQYADIDLETLSDEDLKALLEQHQLKLKSSFTRGKALFELFDALVTPKLIQPTWIIDYPRDISPLAKEHRLNPELAERFEAYVGGKEIADGWSEITDAIDQIQIFENEQSNMRSGDTEAHPLDEDFIEAMEHGMPPLGGIGIGIDRLVMFLTNTWSIKEVIAFPTLRPVLTSKDDVTLAKKTDSQPQKTESENPQVADSGKLPPRQESEELLKKYIENEKLRHHCYMVANAMESYAQALGEDSELWYQTGLLHDLDWEKYPDEHPNFAIKELLSAYPNSLKQAIAAHAPERTGTTPQSLMDNYLFACDELSGFMHAYSLMRPDGFAGMEAKSVKKKFKDKGFAANVSRDDIYQGLELISKDPIDHITFLIEVFQTKTKL